MLRVRDLSISIGTPAEPIDIVSSVSFEIERGEILGLVGKSGCGKSMTSLAVMGLLDKGGPWVRTGGWNWPGSTSSIRSPISASRRAMAVSR